MRKIPGKNKPEALKGGLFVAPSLQSGNVKVTRRNFVSKVPTPILNGVKRDEDCGNVIRRSGRSR